MANHAAEYLLTVKYQFAHSFNVHTCYTSDATVNARCISNTVVQGTFTPDQAQHGMAPHTLSL